MGYLKTDAPYISNILLRVSYDMKSLVKFFPISFRERYLPQVNEVNQELKIIYGKLKRQFIRPSFPSLENKQLNLHLGCGSINHSKFINIDGLPAPHIHYIRAIDDLSIFNDKTVDLIYACHCLEHFSHIKVPQVLLEWFRTLKDGGVLRIAVPNFDLLLNIYKENGNDINTVIHPLMGAQDYKFNFHMTAFNRSSLDSLLKNTGFKVIQEWKPGSCELTTFDNDWSTKQYLVNSKYYPVSLNIEAVK